ncbi:hypothetical protein B0T25DRAFT_623600 [Lasiosphaeria hispida]|uniref:Caib baif family enzyme n=1 Tax=Lasiosphaeria hispida TaxID=260671 RepID=A0AAJ0HJD8_9PEZI|nr:hypothetical protein B0T25DRAFT_623600 [Lasiosphaeria hispida]
MKDELRILTPIGMLGYSFSEDIFWSAVEEGVDAIILDSGSTDSGPSKLAFGETTASRHAYERDLRILVSACQYHHVPVLIGSAGGDGTNAHVALLVEIVSEITTSSNFRPMKVVTIHAEIPKPAIQTHLTAGLITPCGAGAPPLTQLALDAAVVVVAQMGLEPWLAAMRAHPDFDIIIAGRSYDPAPYAAFCVHKGFPDLGVAYHMGKIMECGAVCAVPKSAEALAVVRRGSFDVRPLDPAARCTPLSVAAHTLYEKARPDLLAGPGGVLDVSGTRFAQCEDGRTLRVSGSRFLPVEEGRYTIKLEGARTTGFMAVLVGSVVDPIMIAQLDKLAPMIEAKLRSVLDFEFRMAIRFFGKESVVPGLVAPASASLPVSVGVLVKVLASTQERAKAVTSMAKVFFIHAPYSGQLANAGNFAMPFSPCDLSLGPAAEFCLYHLMQVDDPVAPFPIASSMIGVAGGNPRAKRSTTRKEHDLSGVKADATAMAALTSSQPLQLSPPPPPGFVYLASLAKVVRTKNCGPFELTMDVMFPDFETYKRVVDADVLNREAVVRMYGVEKPEDVLVCLWWEPALAFKATIKRRASSGSFEDDDVHGSCAHVPLMYLVIPQRLGL